MIKPQLASVAVVIHQGQVLLVKRKNNPNAGLWGFPGGHVELGETALACAERELFEETGITASALKYLTNIDLIHQDADGNVAFHYLLAVVHCQFLNGEPIAADDAAAAAWFKVDHVLNDKTNLTDNVQQIVRMLLAA